MSIRYEIDGEVLIIRQNGVTDPVLIAETLAAALADAKLLPKSHLLWDATDAPAQASADKMKAFVRSFDEMPQLSGRIAMLVATDLQWGVSRMFSVYAEDAGSTAAVFYEADEAMRWLRE